MKKLLYKNKLSKSIIFILVILILMTFITPSIYAFVPDGLQSLTGDGMKENGTYLLDNKPIYTYVTGEGGNIYCETENSDYDYHIFDAEPRNGWRFVRWVTYFEGTRRFKWTEYNSICY